jgi:hypothetical protein
MSVKGEVPPLEHPGHVEIGSFPPAPHKLYADVVFNLGLSASRSVQNTIGWRLGRTEARTVNGVTYTTHPETQVLRRSRQAKNPGGSRDSLVADDNVSVVFADESTNTPFRRVEISRSRIVSSFDRLMIEERELVANFFKLPDNPHNEPDATLHLVGANWYQRGIDLRVNGAIHKLATGPESEVRFGEIDAINPGVITALGETLLRTETATERRLIPGVARGPRLTPAAVGYNRRSDPYLIRPKWYDFLGQGSMFAIPERKDS